MQYFNVATNICQRFAIGYPSQPDNFFLEGEIRGNKPFISCRVFDNKGSLLYGLEKNNLTKDTSSRYKFTVTKEGWHRIVDEENNELLKIESVLDNNGNTVTNIYGEFYDKEGKLAARGDTNGLLVNCPLRM